MWLRSPALRIAVGTDEVIKNIIAERVPGLPGDLRADRGIAFNKIPTRLWVGYLVSSVSAPQPGIRTGKAVMPWTKVERMRSASPTTSIFGKRFSISSHRIRSCISASRLPMQR